MLHAFAHHKSRAYTRYLRVREADEPRVSSEDEITSLIFGPLDFLSAADNWKLWKLVLQSHASEAMSGPLPSEYLAGFSPSTCTQHFWPRRGGIEPDLVIEFADQAGATRSLVIELKWDAGVSGADQLEKQWRDLQGSKQTTSLHLFIAKSMGDLPTDMQPWSCTGSDGVVSSRLRALRWHVFKHEIVKLAALPDTSLPLKRWCALASGFLAQVNIRPFVGFHTPVRLARDLDTASTDDMTFWMGASTAPDDNHSGE